MPVNLKCFWTDNLEETFNIPRPAPLPERVDVAVVGSGYTGLQAAAALLQNGATVAVLEQHGLGWGASSRNGGLVLPGLSRPMSLAVKRYGLDTARKYWQWSLDAITHVERTVSENGLDCDFERRGNAYLAYKPSHLAGFRKQADFMENIFGYRDMKVIGPSEMSGEIGSKVFHGAIVEEASAAIDPARYVLGLASVVADHGGSLVPDCRVLKVRRGSFGFELATSQGRILAEEVLLATNGYTDRLALPIRNGIFPIGSYVIVTAPLAPDLQQELSPRGRMFYDSKRFLNYFRLTADGRMLFGGRHDLSPDLDLLDSRRHLGSRLVEVFPQLAGVPITHSWTGNLGITFDLMPHCGKINGIHFAYGYAGHGVAAASLLGYEMGQVLSGKCTAATFMNLRHFRHPVARLEKLFLPLLTHWYRLLDRLT